MERRKFNRNAYYSCVGSASGSASISGSTSAAGSSSNSDFKIRITSSTVSSSRSVFSINISRGAFNTAFAVSIPIALIASITHPSISSLNSSR